MSMFRCRHVTFGAFEEWSFVLRDTRKDGQIFIRVAGMAPSARC